MKPRPRTPALPWRDRVVACTDGSRHAALAVHLAAVEACASQDPFHLEVVVEPDADPVQGIRSAHDLLNRTERAIARGWPDLRVSSAVRHGTLEENLPVLTRSARLLSLGVAGHHAQHRLGSSAATVLRAARCTVLLARAADDGALVEESRAVALAAGSPRDPRFGEVGAELAAHCDAVLREVDLDPRRWRRGRRAPDDVLVRVLGQGPAPGFLVVDAGVGRAVAGVVAAA